MSPKQVLFNHQNVYKLRQLISLNCLKMIKLEKILRIQKKNCKTKIMKIKKCKIMENVNNPCFKKKLMQLIIKKNLVKYLKVFSF